MTSLPAFFIGWLSGVALGAWVTYCKMVDKSVDAEPTKTDIEEFTEAVENFKAELLKACEPFCIPIIEWLNRIVESRQKVTCLICGYPFRGRRCTKCGGEWVERKGKR